MKKIPLFLFVIAAMLSFIGCDSSKHSLVGTWQAEKTTVDRGGAFNVYGSGDRVYAEVIKLQIPENADATFSIAVNSKITDEAKGAWKKVDDFLIVSRTNGGFVAMKITAQSNDRIAVVFRDGEVFQFNRIQ